jgi:hypothetical protein
MTCNYVVAAIYTLQVFNSKFPQIIASSSDPDEIYIVSDVDE